MFAFLRGSSQIRAVFRSLLTPTRDEMPHRNTEYAYLCTTRFCPAERARKLSRCDVGAGRFGTTDLG